MRPNRIEALVPGLKEARENERTNRGLAMAGVPWTICGLLVVPLTPRHRLELQLARNAFAEGLQPSKLDLFNLLWRLNPDFKRAPQWLSKAWWARRKVVAAVRGAELVSVTLQIYEYLEVMLQDLPESRDGADGGGLGGYVHWLGNEEHFYCSTYGGFTPDIFKDTPYLELQQLFRAWRIEHERDDEGHPAEPQFINRSDALVNNWQRQVQKQMAKPNE